MLRNLSVSPTTVSWDLLVMILSLEQWALLAPTGKSLEKSVLDIADTTWWPPMHASTWDKGTRRYLQIQTEDELELQYSC
jgi:hypothetical protein